MFKFEFLRSIICENSETVVNSGGVYVGVRPTKAGVEHIANFMKGMNLKHPMKPKDLHSTVIFSRRYDDVKVNPAQTYTARPLRLHKFGDVLVMIFDAPALVARHKQLMNEYDLTYDFDEYIPHITLSYNYESDDLPKLDDLPTITLTGEYIEDITDPDYVTDATGE